MDKLDRQIQYSIAGIEVLKLPSLLSTSSIKPFSASSKSTLTLFLLFLSTFALQSVRNTRTSQVDSLKWVCQLHFNSGQAKQTDLVFATFLPPPNKMYPLCYTMYVQDYTYFSSTLDNSVTAAYVNQSKPLFTVKFSNSLVSRYVCISPVACSIYAEVETRLSLGYVLYKMNRNQPCTHYLIFPGACHSFQNLRR